MGQRATSQVKQPRLVLGPLTFALEPASSRGLLFLETAEHTTQLPRFPLLPSLYRASLILSFRLSLKRPGRPRFRDSVYGAYVLNSYETNASRHLR